MYLILYMYICICKYNHPHLSNGPTKGHAAQQRKPRGEESNLLYIWYLYTYPYILDMYICISYYICISVSLYLHLLTSPMAIPKAMQPSIESHAVKSYTNYIYILYRRIHTYTVCISVSHITSVCLYLYICISSPLQWPYQRPCSPAEKATR